MSIRIGCFDIETTALDASYGRLVCACFKYLDERDVRSGCTRFVRGEPRLLKWISTNFNELDIVVTWNGKMFDVPFVNARLLTHGMPPLRRNILHKDAMYEAKKLRLRGARLEGVSKDLRTCHRKLDVPAAQWVLAAEGNTVAIAEILRHCEQDVRITEEVFLKLKPMLVRVTQ